MPKKKGDFVPDEYGIIININEQYENEKKKEMENDTSIKINITPESKNKNILTRTSSVLRGEKAQKRTDTFDHYPELAKFSDGQMDYEMNRMMRYS